MRSEDEIAILDTLSNPVSQETEKQYVDTYAGVERIGKTTTTHQCSSSHPEKRYAIL